MGGEPNAGRETGAGHGSEGEATPAAPPGGADGKGAQAEARAVVPLVAAALALLAGAGAIALVRAGDRGALASGVLLAIAALALASVALGWGLHEPEAEGRLDLSARLGLGLLGGVLGGAVATAAWGFLRLASGGLPPELVSGPGAPALLPAILHGGAWGLVLGVVVPWLPGRGATARGILFSLLPSLWVLLKVFPEIGLGAFGLRAGPAALLAVLGLNGLWGAVAGRTIGWGERAERGLSRGLGE